LCESFGVFFSYFTSVSSCAILPPPIISVLGYRSVKRLSLGIIYGQV
jgi:hypothetical protein